MIFLRMIAVVEVGTFCNFCYIILLFFGVMVEDFFMSLQLIKAFCCHHNINNTEITQEGLSLKLKFAKKKLIHTRKQSGVVVTGLFE
jgi:hypothetical protein